MKFTPGDIVALKSGGPAMTVEAVDGNSILCSWFTRSADGPWSESYNQRFDARALEPAEKDL